MHNKNQSRKQLRETRISAGLCMYCGLRPPLDGIKGCEECQKKVRNRQAKWVAKQPDHSAYQKNYREAIRREVIQAYGGKCSCGGETRFEFLTLDHVDNDGAEHRREIGESSNQLVLWAKRNKFPKRLRCMCFNCNVSTYRYGACPHVHEKKDNT